MSSLDIRPAVSADIPALMPMARNFHAASGYSDLVGFCQDSMAATFAGLIAQGIIVVADRGGLIGAVGGMPVPMPFNHGHRTMSELFWWVEPEHRGVGPVLLEAFEDYAHAIGCGLVTMASLEAQNPALVDRLYRRRGYRAVEHTYVRRA